MMRVIFAALALALLSTPAGALVIKASDSVLDCNGGTINENVRISGPIENVTVRNCTLAGGLNIANHRWARATDLLRAEQGHENVNVNNAWRLYREGDPAWRELWDGSPTNVLIEHVTVSGGGKDTVFIGAHVMGVTIKDSRIDGGSATALYLAGGATDIVVEDSRIGGDVHLDGAFANVIRRNLIAGSVRLYKNCGEHGGFPDEDPDHNPLHRPVVTPADDNRIVGNRIVDDVHLASRASAALEYQFCSDASPYPSDEFVWVIIPADNWFGVALLRLPMSHVYFRDYARRNTVRGNVIGGRVIVEDDHNDIRQPGTEVVIGGELRAMWLGEPVLAAP